MINITQQISEVGVTSLFYSTHIHDSVILICASITLFQIKARPINPRQVVKSSGKLETVVSAWPAYCHHRCKQVWSVWRNICRGEQLVKTSTRQRVRYTVTEDKGTRREHKRPSMTTGNLTRLRIVHYGGTLFPNAFNENRDQVLGIARCMYQRVLLTCRPQVMVNWVLHN